MNRYIFPIQLHFRISALFTHREYLFLLISDLINLGLHMMDTKSYLTNLEWARNYLPLTETEKEEAELSLSELAGSGGLIGVMKVLNVALPSNPFYHGRFIIKCTSENGMETSKVVGLPREAHFYPTFSDQFKEENIAIPHVLFASGDMTTGFKVMLMEDLSSFSVQSGYFFGTGTPLNWGLDLPSLTARAPNGAHLSAVDIAKSTFVEIAKIHRMYWKDTNLLNHVFLRNQDRMHGEGRDGWEGAQNFAKSNWIATLVRVSEGKSIVVIDENLKACMEAAFAKVDWENFQDFLKTRPWTLVHGDLHPANTMWVWSVDQLPVTQQYGQGKPMIIDWEMVGLGSGPQDIAQYVISHMDPELRRSNEKHLVRIYYDTLVDNIENNGVENYSFDDCWKDYVMGGAERWLWMVAFGSSVFPEHFVQYFHNQTAAFLRDHGITPDKIGMTRA